MKTDNWQEALVEELARKYSFYGESKKAALREAICRTLEKATKDLQKFGSHIFDCDINNGLEKPCTCGYESALRQLMEPPK